MSQYKTGWMITPSTNNIGDDFQCIAARKFLNKTDVEVDREEMANYVGKKIKMIINGWYMHAPQKWPPSNDILPLITSVHISNTRQKNGKIPSKEMLNGNGLNYLEKYSPIGARDLFTYHLLRKKKIEAYFSGCLTLTLPRKNVKKEDYICLIDPNDEIEKYVRNKTNREIVIVRPESTHWSKKYEERIKQAEDLLNLYARAHLVITSRLHGALPQLAMGTRVIYIEKKFGDERYEGLKYFLNMAMYDDFVRERYKIDFDNPPENPKEFLVLRKNLEKVAQSFISGNMDKVDYRAIHNENMSAYKTARKRTIAYYKKNNLKSIRLHELKTRLRFIYRDLENIIK